MFFKNYKFIICSAISVLFWGNLYPQNIPEFRSPDPSNRAITYWMWMNGNITKQGITKDLEAMKIAGVNGTLFFSVGFYQPGPVNFMSKDWWDAVAYAMKESDRLKMKFGIYNSDGWSMSGGPWITPEQSMKELVWADTLVQGGRSISMKLPQPPINSIYHDISVVAFPALANDQPIRNEAIVSSNLVTEPMGALDNNPKTVTGFLRAKGSELANIVIDFGHQTDLRRVVFDQIRANPFLEASADLEYSNDAKNYIKIEDDFPLNLKAEALVKQLTFNFPKINTRYLRLTVRFEDSTKKPVPISQTSVGVGKILFYASPRINLWEPKSGESKRIRHERQPTFMHELSSETNEILPERYLIRTNEQINLTGLVDKNGILNWTAPPGKWLIQRIGYTSTNRMVGPATEGGRGFECDKMDAKAVETHFNSYSGKIIDLSNKILGKPIDYIQMESWEAGIQNWTEGFENEFKKRNGYSIFPFLPVIAGGYVVNSFEESNKFLWDFRNTCSQLIAQNYWGTMYRLAKAKNVTVSGEGSGMQHYLYDPMRYMQYLDIPMGEFWPNEGHVRADIKNASSVAHTYGRGLSGGESFTSGDKNLWSVTPYDLKQIGDEAFTLGLNHLVLHTYVHQPYDVAPGFTLQKFGNHLQRLNPWYVHAQGWFDYFARCQYMLRQGKSVQDIAYFTGQGIPSYLGLPWELHPKLPEGYDYDGVNTDIIKQMTVKEGDLNLPTGASYKLLVFQDITVMTPELAKEVKRLVADGATIVSAKPTGSPSLKDDASAATTVKEIADEVWGNVDGEKVKEHTYGKGNVYYGLALDEVLKQRNSMPDFIYRSGAENAKINFVHRKSIDTDSYFLANYEKNESSGKGVFRVENKLPELWDPDKGTTVLLPYRILNAHQIEVPLQFDPLGSMFIVFRQATDNKMGTESQVKELSKYTLDNPWNVTFTSSVDSFNTVFEKLTDWSVNEDDRIKYFSGTATYSQDIKIQKTDNSKFVLDLGKVNKNMALVKLNGNEVAHLWKPPYTVDITPFLIKGENHLEILVTNTATNSLIGDERFPSDLKYDAKSNINPFPNWLEHPEQRTSKRKTFVTYKYINKNSEMDASGMQGPVQITVSELIK